MTRYECLQWLATRITDELVVTNIAEVASEWYHVCPREGNLYHIYMSGTTPVALGLAIALPHRRVIALDSDGSLLMGATVLPVIAAQKPAKLLSIVFDNEVYGGSISSQVNRLPTFTAGATDLAAMARGAGIRNARQVRELSEFQAAVSEAFQTDGPHFLVVKVALARVPIPYLPLESMENRYQFIRYLERTEGRPILTGPPKLTPYERELRDAERARG